MQMQPDPSSYRDPAGFMFRRGDTWYRRVNRVYRPHYDLLMQGGLYASLVKKGSLVFHEELEVEEKDPLLYYIIKPRQIPFISYPWEWSFGMLRDAALLTLDIMQECLRHRMILKDATPFNVQFPEGKAVWIDSLSFESYDETKPWIAYRQFCETMLAPLLLAHYHATPLPQILLAYPGGIPLKLASSLLPRRSRFQLHAYLHIHLHAKNTGNGQNDRVKPFSRKKMENILASLRLLVEKCKSPRQESTWSGYYEEAESRGNYLKAKEELVKQMLPGETVPLAIDLGANTGHFSRMLVERASYCIAADADPYCIDLLHEKLKNESPVNMLSLVLDLSHPSPSMGFENGERPSFIERAEGAGLVMALALVHHLALGKNLPLERIASFFKKLCGRWLLIEFVPREDEKSRLLVRGREDMFSAYGIENFETCFSLYFTMENKSPVGESGRVLYLFRKK